MYCISKWFNMNGSTFLFSLFFFVLTLVSAYAQETEHCGGSLDYGKYIRATERGIGSILSQAKLPARQAYGIYHLTRQDFSLLQPGQECDELLAYIESLPQNDPENVHPLMKEVIWKAGGWYFIFFKMPSASLVENPDGSVGITPGMVTGYTTVLVISPSFEPVGIFII